MHKFKTYICKAWANKIVLGAKVYEHFYFTNEMDPD